MFGLEAGGGGGGFNFRILVLAVIEVDAFSFADSKLLIDFPGSARGFGGSSYSSFRQVEAFEEGKGLLLNRWVEQQEPGLEGTLNEHAC